MNAAFKQLRQRLQERVVFDNPHIGWRGRAAILIPLVQRSDGPIKLLFCVRPGHMRRHAGEVCFPGGRRDMNDSNDLNTALRETYEEIGMKPSSIQVLGRLDQILSSSGLLVTPFVGVLPADYSTSGTPNDEIEAVFEVPLSFFVSKCSREMTPLSFEHSGHRIWGLTALVLLRMLEVGYDLEHSRHFHFYGRLKDAFGRELSWLDAAQNLTAEQQQRFRKKN